LEFPDGTEPRNFRLESLAPSVPWFDEHLMHLCKNNYAPVRIYVMGTHEWRNEQEWPLARTRYTDYYLQSDGHANTAAGDGVLSTSPPTSAVSCDTYEYDPNNPVPTAGGAMLGSGSGIARQNAVESRPDVLVYSSAPLDHDTEVTGPITLNLFVSTSAPSTDFTGKLVDVFPDVSAYNVSDGVLRRRYEQQPDSPSGAEEISIALWPTSFVFLKGHRIRLEVSSSNYPRFDRNPNTGGPIATETKPSIASQSICHGLKLPSRLILPVIPPTPSRSNRQLDGSTNRRPEMGGLIGRVRKRL
jgi:putative CocE/NonD family hydrolase